MALSFKSFCDELGIQSESISASRVVSSLQYSLPISLRTLMSKVGSPEPPDITPQDCGVNSNPEVGDNEATFLWFDPSSQGNNAAGNSVPPAIMIRRASSYIINIQPPGQKLVSAPVPLSGVSSDYGYCTNYNYPVGGWQYSWNVASVNKYGTTWTQLSYFGTPGQSPLAQVLHYENGKIYGEGFQSNLLCTVAITSGGGFDPPGPWKGNIAYPGIPIQTVCDGSMNQYFGVTASNSAGQSATLQINC